jgi:hypothetical protein
MPSESHEPTPTVHREAALPPQPGDTADSGLGNSSELDFTLNDVSFLAPPMTPEELGWLAHYRVLKILGQGGMDAVFLAEDSHLRRAEWTSFLNDLHKRWGGRWSNPGP